MATYNYLDKIGLGQVWNKIKSLFTNTSLIGTTTAESINTDELTSGNLIVNGSARFTNGLYGELTGNVIGNISGKAGTADAFSSNKNVTLTGDVTGTASSTGGWSVVTTVGDDSHNHTTQTIVPIAEKTYTGLIGTSSNNAANDSFYFMSVKPDNFYSQWKLTYKITATIPNHNEYRATSFVTLYGVGQASAPIYSIYNQIYSTSYRPYSYHNFQRLTETGFNANYGNAIGIGLRSSNSRSTSGYERTIKIELLETEQCTAILLDNVVKWANWTGTGSTNYAGLSEFDGYNIGLRETGEDNDTTTLQYSTARLTTGSNGIPAYNIVMMKPDGTWEGLTVGNATTATTSIKNTSGFVLGQLYLHWSETNFGANTTVNANGGVRTTQDWTDFRYTLNCGTTLTSYEMVYLKGTMSGGLFYLADTWWTQTLPTTNDGFIYIPVGMCYGSGYACSFWGYHGAYYHNGTTIVEYIAGMPQPDWNENDTTSPNYITNRTHWTDSTTITNVINETGTLANEGFRNLAMFLNPQDISLIQSVTNETPYTIVINGSTYNGTAFVDGYGYIFFGNANLAIDDYESTGESYAIVYSEYNSRIYFTTNEGQVGDSYSVSLSIENTPIHKLDNKYLNGTLIQPGTGKNSEIFNGINEYKVASGSYSHVEGYNGGWNRMIQINLTGEAGATNYDCTVYSYRDGYNSIINAGIYSFADSNYSTIDKKITYIDVPLSLNNPKTGTIYFNETLSQDTNLSNKPFYLVLPQAIASGTGSHAEGGDAMATEYCSHAEGSNTIASGSYSHAEGKDTVASGSTSHAEGNHTTAFNNYSHAEGNYTIANGSTSHAEGSNTTASGNYSHAEGSNTTASGSYSHAEGYMTTASGVYSHVEGRETISQTRSQHVFGEYNVLDTGGSTTTKGNYIEIVGNGTSTSKRSNARTLDWNGNEILKGKLTVGAAPTNNMDVATKQYVDTATSGITTNLSGLTDTTISSPANGQFLQYNSTSSKWENKTYTAPVTSVNGQTGAVSIAIPSASSTTPLADGTGAVGTSTTYARADHVHPKITQALSISSNVITLTGSDGTTSSVTLPVYNGGVSS